MGRHDVVHALMHAIESAGQDHSAIRIMLTNLPPEPPV